MNNCSGCGSTGRIDCPMCDGSGIKNENICWYCHGLKVVKCPLCLGNHQDSPNKIDTSPLCPICKGDGKTLCTNCRGITRNPLCPYCWGWFYVTCPKCHGSGFLRI